MKAHSNEFNMFAYNLRSNIFSTLKAVFYCSRFAREGEVKN